MKTLFRLLAFAALAANSPNIHAQTAAIDFWQTLHFQDVAAAGDYFEVRVRHDSGSAQDLIGGDPVTMWFALTVVPGAV